MWLSFRQLMQFPIRTYHSTQLLGMPFLPISSIDVSKCLSSDRYSAYCYFVRLPFHRQIVQLSDEQNGMGLNDNWDVMTIIRNRPTVYYLDRRFPRGAGEIDDGIERNNTRPYKPVT